jgi:hypothetical protein
MVLTGLIHTVGTSGNPMNIGLIEELVTSYISKENCIILMTITCESMPAYPPAQSKAADACDSGFRKSRRV